MQKKYDRAAEDVGNSVSLEHINVMIPDQTVSTDFYVAGLGLTRDPYLMGGTNNMWINCGRSQFHMPTGKPQVLRGHVGIVMEDRKALLERLTRAKQRLKGTKFAFKEHNAYVEAVSPWGNVVRVYEPDLQRFGRINLGIPYVEFDVPEGTADGIARFYKELIETPAYITENGDGKAAHAVVGQKQEMIFRETDKKLAKYDGHHLQIYLADFSGPHKKLLARNLVTEESDQYQYRFKDIVDPKTNKLLFTIEHEIRSMTHPLYARPLVNRNPTQTNRDYAPEFDSYRWNMPHDEHSPIP
jgi:hypothetical protein